MLSEMLDAAERKHEIADLNYELWKMENGKRKRVNGKQALRLYQELYEKSPNCEYRKRIEELTK